MTSKSEFGSIHSQSIVQNEDFSTLPTTSHNQFYSNNTDPCAQVVHVLLCYHQGGEDLDFIKKAIESLVKKLKDRRMQLDSLISAVTSGGKQQTDCVTIHRSLDGRLQVAGRKGVPHVVYARIWRWPNVNKNELQKLPTCNTPIDHPDLICINPFHYDRIVSSGINNIDNLDQVQVPFIPSPEHWCTILYYELDTQVGEVFKVPRELSEVIVDGGMDPSGGRLGRFCLGALSNVHRTEASEKARIHIGRGIKLRITEDGSVYLKCLSQKGVFVRSYFLDFEHNLIYGSTVHKFCSGAEKKLFDLRWAFAEMCEQRESAQMAVVAQAYAVAGIMQLVTPSFIERAGIGVDDLRRVCCTIAISFVKGWGSGYNRSSIKETPCWIEIHLHRPLQLLNFLLQKTE